MIWCTKCKKRGFSAFIKLTAVLGGLNVGPTTCASELVPKIAWRKLKMEVVYNCHKGFPLGYRAGILYA